MCRPEQASAYEVLPKGTSHPTNEHFENVIHSQNGRALEMQDGTELPGKVIGFNFDTKELTVEAPSSGKSTVVPTRELSLRSKQTLLFSQVFHRSYPEGKKWPREKVNLTMNGILAPVIALLGGFWIAGWLIGGKFNPVRAFFGFFGGWIVGTLFVVFYLFSKSLKISLI